MSQENLFNLMGTNDSVKEFMKDQEKQKEEIEKKKTTEKKQKLDAKANKPKNAPTVLKTDKDIEDAMHKLLSIEVKVFGTQVLKFDTEEAIAELSLKELHKQLVEMGYKEFQESIKWNLCMNKEKTEGVLIATYKFFNKG